MKKFLPVILLSLSLLAIFLTRALLAAYHAVPHTFDLFDSLTVVGACLAIWRFRRSLNWSNWVLALGLGAVIGIEMQFATLFTPYPFWGVVKTVTAHAIVRGTFTAVAALGGIAIMKQGGPVQFFLAKKDWQRAGHSALVGLGVGLPLAIVNVFALQMSEGQSVVWQNILRAAADALQPGVVEEVIYRFALWGLLWLVLRTSLNAHAPWVSGLLAMLVHNYAHFDALFLESPLAALGMGAALALFWGFPPMILARRKGLESAVAFHWIQDAARFFAGF